MFKFKGGKQFDDATSVYDISADHDANASVKLGSLQDRAKTHVTLDAGGRGAASASSLWLRGLFFVGTLIILIALFVLVATKYGTGLAWASLGAALVVLYFLALVLLPGTVTEKGFLSVLKTLFVGK